MRRCGHLLILLLFATTCAQAGDAIPLPTGRAPKSEKDRACAAEGEGFVWSPSARTCVRLGGAVIIDVGKGSTSSPSVR